MTREAWPYIVGAGITGEGRPRSVDHPAPAITGKGTAYLLNSAEAWRHPDWVFRRPSTTITSDSTGRVGRPGHKHRGPDCCTKNREAGEGEPQFAVDAVRLSPPQAALVQGFPTDYPWQGTKSQQFQQIGNAVPPPLARAVLSALTARVKAHQPTTEVTMIEPHDCDDCGTTYDEAGGDGYAGLCPSCADRTEEV